MILVDASVALKVFLNEPDSQQAASLAERSWCAPAIILAEVANGLWKNWRLGIFTEQDLRSNLSVIRGLFAELTEMAGLLARAGELSITLDHSVYDCFYLADAEARRMKLVTADERLLRRIKGTELESRATSLS